MNPSPCKKNQPADMAQTNISDYEKTPLNDRFPIKTTFELIRKQTGSYAKDPALAQLYTAQKDEKETCLNFRQLNEKLTQTANLLHNIGVGRNDTVTILLPSIMENQITLWGSQAVGIANPVNHFLDIELIIEIMNEVKSKILITLTPGDTLGLNAKVQNIIKQVPSLTHVLLTKDTASGKTEPDSFARNCLQGTNIKALDFNKAIEAQPGDDLCFSDVPGPEDTAIYFHTGGTTGKPKIAMLTHSSVTFVAQVYADFNLHHGRSAVLNPLPLFHVFGTIAASLAIFIQGRCVVMMTPTGFRNPNVVKNWWYFVEYFQVSWFATVPTILSALLNAPIGDNNIDCLKYINSGSAPLPVDLKKSCARKFKAEVVSGYGMTESSCLIARCINGYITPDDTVGIRIPYTKLITAKLLDRSIVRICKPGEPGVVLAKGPNIFKGYLNPKENEKAWVEGEWFNTGDIGIIDKNKYIKLTGRAKDLIIRGGHNIDPQTIEAPLENHPAILQAVAVGQPDAYAGEIPVVYVCLKNGHAVKEEDLIRYCTDHIPERAAIPKRIETIDAMPLTAVGKISKPVLRNLATEYAVNHVLRNAGFQVALSAQNDPQKGQVIYVGLVSGKDKEKVKTLLTGFPISIEFNTPNES